MTGPNRPYEHPCANTIGPDLRAFIDLVVVPALLERFLREHGSVAATVAATQVGLPKVGANV